MKGNLIFGQSGGPTSVINSSAAGVFLEALKHSDRIEKVYGAHHGILGILHEDFFDMGQEEPEELQLMTQTPSSILGSCRYKLADPEEDASDYERILEVFKKYKIRYFFYNGGNDSMDTCNKISKFLQEKDYACQVIGVPKTIDNDLAVTDHCPGYGSAARYIATTMMEIYQDAHVYERGQITVVEIMGRNAGWLTAAASLASLKGAGPDLLYLPEEVLDIDALIADTKRVYEAKGKVIIAISEGCRVADGRYIPELEGEVSVDAFGHKQMGGAAEVLGRMIQNKIDCKLRAIELSLMQRCAAHLASKQDVDDSFASGQAAVRAALDGKTDIMIGFARPETGAYETLIKEVPLEAVANAEKKLPDAWIDHEAHTMKQAFFDYALPLIQGQPQLVLEDSLPRFARLKFVQAGQKKA